MGKALIINIKTIILLGIFFAACGKKDTAPEPDPVTPPQVIIPRPGSIGIDGDTTDVVRTVQGGLLIMGGSTDVDEGIKWLLQRSGGGDIVVLRASGSTGYNSYMFTMHPVNSVETLLINSVELAENEQVARIVRNAEALFIAGGDQWNYTQFWKGTKLYDAINYLLTDKKAPVGGTSAGAAILGEHFFDARYGTVTTTEALINPYHQRVSLNSGFLLHPLLTHTITDTHYDNPDRRGRHTAFLARLVTDRNIPAKGIGIEEKTAMAIDDKGTIKVFGTGKAWMIDANNTKPETIKTGEPLTWNRNGKGVKYTSIQGSKAGTEAGNINNWNTLTGSQTGFFRVENGIFSMVN
jgi:cyanophycinase